MRKIVTLGFAAGLLAAALPAQAANSSATGNRNEAAPAQQSQANADPNRQICVVEARSESRIRRQVCHTAREWRDLQGDGNNE